MLTELSVVEQRYLAVREALDGAKINDVAMRYGVDRRMVHRWLLRYANEGRTHHQTFRSSGPTRNSAGRCSVRSGVQCRRRAGQ